MIGLRASAACGFEAMNLTRAFFPGETVREGDGDISICLTQCGETVTVTISDSRDGRRIVQSEQTQFNKYLAAPDWDVAVGRAFYRAASAFTGRQLPWGILTGVRPAKLFQALTAQLGTARAEAVFREEYYVRPGKTALCEAVARERPSERFGVDRGECSLYVSIPFCPSRCAYCSFVSQDNDHTKPGMIEQYLELLADEIDDTCAYIRDSGQKIRSVYVGGGTPGILSTGQLVRLAEQLLGYSGDSYEFTIELGRPDAIPEEKLRGLRALCNPRICINPQTLHDSVLQAIGRRHTTEQFYAAYRLAEAVGFDDINTDLIAGLPGDTPEGFRQSLAGIIALAPTSVTVHSYARKRSSRLAQDGGADRLIAHSCVDGMLQTCDEWLPAAGYAPYYLYRQKDISGGNENVGWCREHRIGYYNIYMMDELHSIYGCGAGSVTKTVRRGGTEITRFFDRKLPLEYIKQYAMMKQSKREYLQT